MVLNCLLKVILSINCHRLKTQLNLSNTTLRIWGLGFQRKKVGTSSSVSLNVTALVARPSRDLSLLWCIPEIKILVMNLEMLSANSFQVKRAFKTPSCPSCLVTNSQDDWWKMPKCAENFLDEIVSVFFFFKVYTACIARCTSWFQMPWRALLLYTKPS